MTPERIEYWHEQLGKLAHDMETEPVGSIDVGKQLQWRELLKAIATARIMLRQMHGNWESTPAFREQWERWEKKPRDPRDSY